MPVTKEFIIPKEREREFTHLVSMIVQDEIPSDIIPTKTVMNPKTIGKHAKTYTWNICHDEEYPASNIDVHFQNLVCAMTVNHITKLYYKIIMEIQDNCISFFDPLIKQFDTCMVLSEED